MRDEYVHGSTAHRLGAIPNEKEKPKLYTERRRRARKSTRRMNFPYVLFLSTAMIFTGLLLIGYITVQSDITNSIKNISSLENQLNDLKLENDEEYSRITSSVDLEEVKKVAIDELGMKYAGEGQIVNYSGEDSDYVRQFSDLPTK